MCKMNIASCDKETSPHMSTLHGWPLLLEYPPLALRPSKAGRNTSAISACLATYMRHNSVYIYSPARSDGKTETARSENTGVETDWYAQPSPQLCFRCFVQREPLLRSQ